MVNITVPDWGVVVSLIAFALMLSGFVGAINARIGKLEGKLNGTFKRLCDDVERHDGEIDSLKIDVAVVKQKVS